MTNMNKFAAQQLTKKQMNEVKGGLVSVGCTIRDQEGHLVEMLCTVHAETLEEAMDGLLASLGNDNAFNCKVFTA